MQVDTAVIFAGGKSRRMGEDKSKLPFGGYESLARFQYEKLKKIFQKVYISVKDEKFNFTEDLIIENEGNFAPTYGLLECIKTLKKPFFALGVDIPFVDENLIQDIIKVKDRDIGFPTICIKV